MEPSQQIQQLQEQLAIKEQENQQLLAQLNQRSNSLFPYVLKDVLLANPANDGEHVDLRVAVTRGDKHETISIKAHKKGEAHYGLVEFHVTPEST